MYKSGPLIGQKWYLWSIVFDGEPVERTYDAWGIMTLAKDGKVIGRGGCNRFTGYYVRDRARIQFGPMSMTWTYGDRNKAIEMAFFKALEEVRTFRIDGYRLVMFSEDRSIVLVFMHFDFVKPRFGRCRTVVRKSLIRIKRMGPEKTST